MCMLVDILSIEKKKEFETFYVVWRPDRGFKNVSVDEPLLFCLLQIRTILHKVIPSSLCVPPLCYKDLSLLFCVPFCLFRVLVLQMCRLPA